MSRWWPLVLAWVARVTRWCVDVYQAAAQALTNASLRVDAIREELSKAEDLLKHSKDESSDLHQEAEAASHFARYFAQVLERKAAEVAAVQEAVAQAEVGAHISSHHCHGGAEAVACTSAYWVLRMQRQDQTCGCSQIISALYAVLPAGTSGERDQGVHHCRSCVRGCV